MSSHEFQPTIVLRGVRVHNLQQIDLDIPRHALTAITGVSGAGKSSLALDTLYAEAYHRYLQSLSPYLRQHLEQVQRPDADRIDNLPPAVAVSQRHLPQGPRVTAGTLTETLPYLRLLFVRAGTFHCQKCGQPVRPSTVADVLKVITDLPSGTRFNIGFPRDAAVETPPQELLDQLRQAGYVRVEMAGQTIRLEDVKPDDLAAGTALWVLVDRLEVGKASPQRLQEDIATSFAGGQGRLGVMLDDRRLVFDQRAICPNCDTPYPWPEARLLDFNDPEGACPECGGTGLASSVRRGKSAHARPCPACRGQRLGPVALAVTLGGANLAEVSALTITDLLAWCQGLEQLSSRQQEITLIRNQVTQRLENLARIGLGYLSLDRAASSLAPGEIMRLRLASALTADLAGVLYVLDEPSTGLHLAEIATLLSVLRQLCDAGSTVVMVENNRELVRGADHVIDLGLGAGEEGGRICYQGPPAGLPASAESVTAAYFAGRQVIAVPRQRRAAERGSIRIEGASAHNLLDFSAEIPLGVLSVITGVSGSGKSTLLEDVLLPGLARRPDEKAKSDLPAPVGRVYGAGQLGDVVYMDRRPLPRSARTNPATYIKAFDAIREEFADTTDAKIHNFDAAAFSFNQPGGRCESCQGHGMVTVDMQFLADISVVCPDCHGTRYRKELLEIKVRGRSIAEVLALTAREAFRFFRAHPAIQRRIKPLLDVGLDYLRLGQATDTLSGGEAQRLKLAGHLAASRKPRCLFLFDEPTAGLHPADIARLLECFDRLLQAGHSLIVLENQLDVIKSADFVLDLGPDAGKEGGRVVAAGTPEEVAAVPESITGKHLRSVLVG